MCSLQDAFPDLAFNNSNKKEDVVSKAKTDLLKMQEERGTMMEFQCSDVTTPYFLQNNPNIPHVADTRIEGAANVETAATTTTTTTKMANNESFEETQPFTPEIITDPKLLAQQGLQQVFDMFKNMNERMDSLENKVNNRNSHDMILFIIVVVFVVLIIETIIRGL